YGHLIRAKLLCVPNHAHHRARYSVAPVACGRPTLEWLLVVCHSLHSPGRVEDHRPMHGSPTTGRPAYRPLFPGHDRPSTLDRAGETNQASRVAFRLWTT